MGKHVICSVYGVPFSVLNDREGIVRAFDVAVSLMGANVLHKFSHQFQPQGLTVVYVLSESHISCHTFPELGSAALDCYTCGNMDPEVGMEHLIKCLSPTKYKTQTLPR